MNPNTKTRQLLVTHYQAHPKLKIQDLFKFLYQSSFGCEHLVTSLDDATAFITKEYEENHSEEEPTIVPLDGAYSRVPLSYLNHGLSAQTLGKLFVASAKPEKNGFQNLVHKITIAKDLIKEGILPFPQKDFEEAEADWKANGYPAIHHSDAFREAYKPSYRVIANDFIPLLVFFTELDARLAKGNAIVAVEGGSASGKTTLGNLLSNLYDCTLFHMDDFFLQPMQRTPERFAQIGGNIDWERFLTEVLKPLHDGQTVCYRRFDCGTMCLEAPVAVMPKKLTIIEGAYSMHPQLERYYDFSIFLDISPQLQKERILKRNSAPLAKRFFEEWIPLENLYFRETNIKIRCNITIPISEFL